MPRYYRVLYSPRHVSEWVGGARTSFHHATPGDWLKAWQEGKRDLRDYPLETSGGVYTEAARDHFLARIPELGSGGIWPFADLRAASEVAGVCAFDTPRAAVEWNGRKPAKFVEFEGDYVCPAPDDPGAVVARVREQIGDLMSESEFREKHELLS